MHYLVTGATGFIGSHVVEACVARGQRVTALVRPQSDAALLESWGVPLCRAELQDTAALRRLLGDVDVVVHCAAKVGDWGPVEEYRAVNVDALRSLLEACKGQALSRFIYLSSLGVYPLGHHYGTDETAPLPVRHADGYTQSKVEAEQLARSYYRDFGVPVVVLRPGFVYGPRDRTVLPRLLDALRQGQIRYPGGGQAALNTIYVGNLVEAIFLAVAQEQAVGQVYNLTDGEYVSKRRFVEYIADFFQLPRPTRTPPLWLARWITWGCETWARWRGARQAPRYTQARLKFFGYHLDFSIAKAQRELGYRPRYSFEQGMFQTLQWYKQQLAGASSPAPAS
jgi:nucleoside-diphosphate-sugar epimerase